MMSQNYNDGEVTILLVDFSPSLFAKDFATANGGVGLGLEELLAEVEISFWGLLLCALKRRIPGLYISKEGRSYKDSKQNLINMQKLHHSTINCSINKAITHQ